MIKIFILLISLIGKSYKLLFPDQPLRRCRHIHKVFLSVFIGAILG